MYLMYISIVKRLGVFLLWRQARGKSEATGGWK
jgi:hypothetical protein